MSRDDKKLALERLKGVQLNKDDRQKLATLVTDGDLSIIDMILLRRTDDLKEACTYKLAALAESEECEKAERQIFTAKLVCPISLQIGARKEEVHLLFPGCPTYEALADRIEQKSTALDLEQVNYSIRRPGTGIIGANDWELLTRGLTSIDLEILPLKARTLSSFTPDEGLELLLRTKCPSYPTSQSFPLAKLDTAATLDPGVTQVTGFETVGDLLSHLGADLALRCLRREPHLLAKEKNNREIISPVLHAAFILAGYATSALGDLELAAELSLKDRSAAGRVDWAVLPRSFGITVVDGSCKPFKTLKESEGQLFASMHACRGQYLQQTLKKRKWDRDPMIDVPSVGILTDGTGYLFYKCCYDGEPQLVCSKFMAANLRKSIEAKKALEAVLDILRTMLQMFLDQERAVESFQSKKQQTG